MAINLECPLLQGEVSPWGLPSTSTRTVIKAAVYMFFFVRRISRLHVHVSGIPRTYRITVVAYIRSAPTTTLSSSLIITVSNYHVIMVYAMPPWLSSRT
jgi:hypothetical protein